MTAAIIGTVYQTGWMVDVKHVWVDDFYVVVFSNVSNLDTDIETHMYLRPLHWSAICIVIDRIIVLATYTGSVLLLVCSVNTCLAFSILFWQQKPSSLA